jgi:cytochrome c553
MRPALVIIAVLTGGLPAAFASPPDPPLAPAPGAAGKAAACASCHGQNGNGASSELPRLAGQSAAYLAEQLRQFRSGARRSPVMNPLATALSDSDIDDLAAYYAAQSPAAVAAKPAATSAEGMMEQQLRLQGYKLSMVRGSEMYCRREAPLGSRLGSQLHCVTVAEAELMAKEGRETAERIQRGTPGCLNPASGGCGK